jgi:Phage capsid family
MNVSENITRLATKQAADLSTLEGLVATLDKDTGNTTVKAQIDALTEQMQKDAGALVSFQNIEKAQARLALPVAAPAIVTARPRGEVKAEHIWRAGVVMLDAYHTRRSIDEVLRARYGGDELTRDVAVLSLNHNSPGRGLDELRELMLERAAQNPAMTNVPGYAQELVHQTYAAFLDALTGTSAVAKVQFRSDSFANGAPIVVPYRVDKEPFPDNFEAAFRREGDPIRVGRLRTGAKTLYPYSMAVIGHFTRELLRRSTPSIEAMIRQGMLDDTASILDNLVFGNGAATAGLRPAGLTNGIDPTDTHAATATPTIADIDSDLNKLVKQLVAVRKMGGPSTSWVMNTANALALSSLTNALGGAAFPGLSAAGGTLKGYPVAASSFFPLTEVLLVDGAGVFMAGGTPEFDMSTEATLHEENTAPLPIATGAAGAGVVATPVRSLWQTNSAALRMLEEISWDELRTGAVQQLTGVAW